jgi:mono/diheme cytochrome c family protein
MNKFTLLVFAGIIVAVALVILSRPNIDSGQVSRRITVPDLTATQAEGRSLFNDKCLLCHGKNASGTTKGPSFIHKVYRPNHHSDGAFFLAARNGVRAHHWSYGNMPAIVGIPDRDLNLIVEYIRAVQRANGIK